jgi:sulfate adenylyltransferase
LNADATPPLPGELRDLPTLAPGPAELADLELLLSGAFHPVTGFMGAADAAAARAGGRLADGTPWPAPIVLAAPEELAKYGREAGVPDAAGLRLEAGLGPVPGGTTGTGFQSEGGPRVVLTDPEGVPVALLTVTEVWREPAPAPGHAPPLLDPLRTWAATPWRLAGPVKALRAPKHGPFRALHLSPAQVRAELDARRPVLAVATRTPLHRRQLGQLRQVAEKLDAKVLVIAMLCSRTGDPAVAAGRRSAVSIGAESLVRALLAARKDLPSDALTIAVPLAERIDARGDLLLTGHVAAAYGATHLLDFTPAGTAGTGTPIDILTPEPWAYDTDVEVWRPATKIDPDHARADLTDAELAAILDNGDPIPTWFTPSAVAAELRRAHPPRYERGLTVLFTGLSGSGKSTIARGVADALVERGGRTVTLLDGDVVRRLLSAGLTFSRDDRDLNIRRIGYVAAEITRHGGVAICAPIAPYASTRAEVRRMVGEVGDFVLVHVATPLAECERRDRKGLYAKARAGLIPEFTGVSDPYEEPDDADLRIDTTGRTPEDAVNDVLHLLTAGGWARSGDAF